MKVRILNEAEQDLIDGILFYDAQSPGLGDYFLDSLSADIDSLHWYGGIHPVRKESTKPCRRLNCNNRTNCGAVFLAPRFRNRGTPTLAATNGLECDV